MNATDLLAKAEVAAASAQALLERGDPDGAVNRAYDAMFDAARVQFISAAQTHCFALMHRYRGLHLQPGRRATTDVDASAAGQSAGLDCRRE